ncbi:hypothetical protein CCP3SC1AL1_380008 [Gammaproteobacteria bacterium]
MNLWNPVLCFIITVGFVGCETTRPTCSPPFSPQEKNDLPLVKSVEIFFDVSASMEGFVSPQRGEKSSYIDLVGSIPEQLRRINAEKVSYYSFGKKIQDNFVLAEVTQPRSYKCDKNVQIKTHDKKIKSKPEDIPDCNNQESRIDKVLEKFNTKDDSLQIIFTDLFLNNTEVLGAQADALRRALEKSLRKSRSFALLGVRSSFHGKIYDLPSGEKYEKATSRPFYMLIFGPSEPLSRLVENVSFLISNTLPADAFHLAVFTKELKKTNTPLMFSSVVRSGSSATEKEISSATPLVSGIDREIPQFRLVTPLKDSPIQVTLPLSSIQLKNGLPIGNFTVYSDVWWWVSSGKGSVCKEHWVKFENPPPIFEIYEKSGTLYFKIALASVNALPPRRTYAVSTKVKASILDVKVSDIMPWVSNWSFSAETEETLVRNGPKFFPTLNLGQFVSVLANALQTQSKTILVLENNAIFRIDR